MLEELSPESKTKLVFAHFFKRKTLVPNVIGTLLVTKRVPVKNWLGRPAGNREEKFYKVITIPCVAIKTTAQQLEYVFEYIADGSCQLSQVQLTFFDYEDEIDIDESIRESEVFDLNDGECARLTFKLQATI